MMKENLESLLYSLKTRTLPKYSTLVSTEEKVQWFPVLQCGGAGLYVGLLTTGEWVVEGRKGLYLLSESHTYLYVMVLLEESISTIKERLEKTFNASNLQTDIDDIFPFVEITRAGFTQKSNYWANLAFGWFDEMPNKKQQLLKTSITYIVHAKWASQKLRQRAKRALQSMKK